MKVAHVESLICKGEFASSVEYTEAMGTVLQAVQEVEWPIGSGQFIINPMPHANGVRPLKAGFVRHLKASGWRNEQPVKLKSNLKVGNIDHCLSTSHGPIAIEWETGNVSSCHRSMNKLWLALHEGSIASGVLVLPSRSLYDYLTFRIANYKELVPYFPCWRDDGITVGALSIIVFEHDGVDVSVPLIPKGTEGLASAKATHTRKEGRFARHDNTHLTALSTS